jgi:hypothetical protein
MADDSLSKTLIIVVSVLLFIAAVVLIVVVALEPQRREIRERCHHQMQSKQK